MDDETERNHLLLAERHIHDCIRRIRSQQALLAKLDSAQRNVGNELLAALFDSLRAGLKHRRII
ncbi:hypothetical protein OKW34_005536 [Paraburkholderia youngii]|uniref:hypothetical protein n=1 Tax=Paraburkholderia youngii TaxID=2782701 RepID=UPI003D23A7B7